MSSTKKHGFTIIEVILVLAIAGLIFSMVFIALPALIKAQKNSQRKDDLARLLSVAEDYGMNTNGLSPVRKVDGSNKHEVLGEFVRKFMDTHCEIDPGKSNSDRYEVGFRDDSCQSDFLDPNGVPYRVKYVNNPSQDTAGNKDKSVDITSNFSFNGVLNQGDIDYVFYGFSNASCGDEEGQARFGRDERDIAVFYVLEGGEILCVDNS